jgi:murein DD-endopeptidase MepM/ murein hydrolase activator NlpD
VWEGLIGIDLNAKPGTHEVEISAFKEGVQCFESRRTLEVLSKEFPERRITVEQKFATPPQSQLERIRLESKKVSGILARITPEKMWHGTFLRPVPGKAISSFGKRSIVNGQPRSPHSGTDFRAAEGTPVKAPNAGKVVLVQDLFFAGNTVILDHGLGLYSYFAHLSKFSVGEGQVVAKGDVVGDVGSTGRVTGPHLHWTVRLTGTRVDPLSLMAVLEATSRDSR